LIEVGVGLGVCAPGSEFLCRLDGPVGLPGPWRAIQDHLPLPFEYRLYEAGRPGEASELPTAGSGARLRRYRLRCLRLLQEVALDLDVVPHIPHACDKCVERIRVNCPPLVRRMPYNLALMRQP